MAKAIKKYQNGLSIRFLKKQKKYYITYGGMHIKINNMYSHGYQTIEEAENVLINLNETYSPVLWTTTSLNPQ